MADKKGAAGNYYLRPSAVTRLNKRRKSSSDQISVLSLLSDLKCFQNLNCIRNTSWSFLHLQRDYVNIYNYKP